MQTYSEKKDHWFFNAHGQSTQAFYDKAKEVIGQLRNEASDNNKSENTNDIRRDI